MQSTQNSAVTVVRTPPARRNSSTMIYAVSHRIVYSMRYYTGVNATYSGRFSRRRAPQAQRRSVAVARDASRDRCDPALRQVQQPPRTTARESCGAGRRRADRRPTPQ